jgi:hypothetical protein
VQEIEQAISELPPERLVEFRAWFAEFDADAWDAQIARDATAGRVDALANEPLEVFRSGR